MIITKYLTKLFNFKGPVVETPPEPPTEPKNNNSPTEPLEMSDKIKGIVDSWTLEDIEEASELFDHSSGRRYFVEDTTNSLVFNYNWLPYGDSFWSLRSRGVEFRITQAFHQYVEDKVDSLKEEERAAKKRPILDELGYDK